MLLILSEQAIYAIAKYHIHGPFLLFDSLCKVLISFNAYIRHINN